MSLIVEKIGKNDAFDSQRSAVLRHAMAGLTAATSLSGGLGSGRSFLVRPNSEVIVLI
jgi:hypothetical protein